METNTVYRVGVIGVGAIAQACHLPGYARQSGVSLVAYSDPEPLRHQEMRGLYPEMKGYAHFQHMLDQEKLDVVSICTPNKFHASAAIAALKAGCHVLCEKPMACSHAECEEMMAAAKKARRKLMIGFTHRLFTGPQKCHELLKARRLGKPFMVRVRFAHGGPYPGWAKDDWFYKKELAAGGAILDMGIHAIDLCLWLMGAITAVSGRAATLIRKIEVEDNAVMILEFKNGALGYIDVGWTSKPGFSGFELYGTEGTLICDYLKGLQWCGGKASAGSDSAVAWKMLDPHPTSGGWNVEIDHWMNVVRGEEKLTMDAKAGINALDVALAAYKSNKTGRRVSLV